MKFIAIKTSDGEDKGEISFCCKMLKVSRQGFYKYLENRDKPWKYEWLAEEIQEILSEDEYNDCYGRVRIYEAIKLRNGDGNRIPSERTIYRIMEKMGIAHTKKRKPNGLTKADKEAQASDDLIKRDFKAEDPLEKGVTDITMLKASDGKLYISAIFDCFDSCVLGLAMDTHMQASLCVETLRNAYMAYPGLRGAIIHSDRGSQYTSEEYRTMIKVYGINQSMNSAVGRCHDNAKCESMWGRMKEEMIYGRINTEDYTVEELKAMVFRYFMSYWNNRRICSANGGLPPKVKRERYYASMALAA